MRQELDRIDLTSIIGDAATKYNLDPHLISAVIDTESSGDPSAVNKAGGGKGAYGAMQVRQAALTDYNSAHGTKYGMDDLLSPKVGIDVGSWYLNNQLDKFKDPAKALIAYNEGAGSPTVDVGSSPYATKILNAVQQKYGKPQAPATLPGIPNTGGQPALSDDAIFQSFAGGGTGAAGVPAAPTDDDIFKAFQSGPQTPPPRTFSDGKGDSITLHYDQPPAAAPTPTPSSALQTAKNAGLGLIQGLGDVPAGIAQSEAHQGLNMLKSIDGLLGTNLAPTGAQNMAQIDTQAKDREAAYQAATPGSVAAGTGRVVGSLLPIMLPGGAETLGAPIARAATFGEQLLKNSPVLGRLLGASGASAAEGAAMGSAAPVTQGDYDTQALRNTEMGALLGGAVPPVAAGLQGLGRYASGVAHAIVDPFTSAGQDRIAQNILARAAQGGPIAGNNAQIVPGSIPTLAETTGNSGIATLQRTMRDLNTVPFVKQEQANSQARSNLWDALAGTPDDIAAAQVDRAKTALPKLQAAFANAGPADPRYVDRAITRILNSPSGQRDVVVNTLNGIRSKLFEPNPFSDRLSSAYDTIDAVIQKPGRMSGADHDALLQARTSINSARRGHTDEEGLLQLLGGLSPTSKKASGAVTDAMKAVGSGAMRYQSDPAQLYGVRQAVTDLMKTIGGRDNSAAQLASRELRVVKLGLDRAIEKAAPGFTDYLKTYAEKSKPIDAMKYLQDLRVTEKNGNITLAKINNAIEAIEAKQASPGVQKAKSIDAARLGALKALQADLLRAENTQLGISRGSPSGQNLATQNFLASALPGKVGAIVSKASPSTIGSTVGGLAGWLSGGPVTGAVGSLMGGRLGSALGAGMNAQNEAIQSALMRLLLNSDSGLAALNRAASAATPVTQIGPLQRFLYPALTTSGSQGLSRLGTAPGPNR